ncbi:hypothetical protein C8J57DRAFT_1533529 [Mycena rebaudengoi]|nr:hypothetical protein C8J57DRAFT_1533529 [Mycena rebaudengoi]
MRAQVGSFCLVTTSIFIIAEVLSLYAEDSYRCGPDNIPVLFIGGIPMAVLTVLSVTLGVAAKQSTIVTRITAIEELAGADDLTCSSFRIRRHPPRCLRPHTEDVIDASALQACGTRPKASVKGYICLTRLGRLGQDLQDA